MSALEGRDGMDALYAATPFFDEHDELVAYRTLIRRLPLSVFFKDRDRQFVGVNDFYADAMGRTPTELIGLSDTDVHPSDEAELYRNVDERVMTEGVDIQGLTEVQTRLDGAVVRNETSKFPVRNSFGEIVGLMGFAHDVTEPTRVVQSLRESEMRYALATRASRDGIWDFDIESKTLAMSPRCCQLLNLPITSGNVPWNVVASLFGEDDLRVLIRGVQALRRQPNDSFQCEVQLDVDGTCRWLSLVYTAFTVDGEVVRIIGSAADVSEEHERRAQLEFFALHDALTGLANRRALVHELEAALDGLRPVSLLCIDLDSFKVINDSLGHQAGDAMLQEVSERLQRVAVGRHLTVARLGGDEFAIVVRGQRPDRVERLASEVLAALRTPTRISGLEIYPSASIGVVHVVDQADAGDVLRDGDIALYHAKGDGKARYAIFDAAMRDRAQRALDAQTQIRRAVERREFSLVYQPVVEAGSRQVVGFEALIRLERDDGTTLPPSEFLGYLEQSDLIIEVGRWVLDQALEDLAAFRAEFPELAGLDVGVNVSRRQFVDPRLLEHIMAAVERNGLTPNELVLEITETAVASQTVDVKTLLAGFREAGGKVAIDDFGTGQSSLFALHQLPVDIIKLDKSFTARITPDTTDPVLRATFDFVHSLNLLLVAEGVETEHQAAWLEDHGARFLQGYVFERPLGFEAARRYLANTLAALD